MKKIYCYSPIFSCLGIVMSSLGLGMLSLCFVLEGGEVIYQILFFSLSVLVFLTGGYLFFLYRQYLFVEDGKLILRCVFYKIQEINLKECYYEIVVLSSYISRGYHSDKWICIYSNKDCKKFTEGLSNSKKNERIQLIATVENLAFIEKVLGKPKVW